MALINATPAQQVGNSRDNFKSACLNLQQAAKSVLESNNILQSQSAIDQFQDEVDLAAINQQIDVANYVLNHPPVLPFIKPMDEIALKLLKIKF